MSAAAGGVEIMFQNTKLMLRCDHNAFNFSHLTLRFNERCTSLYASQLHNFIR